MTQRGTIRRDRGSWRLVYRAGGAPGERRRQRSVKLGTVAELASHAAARRAADRYLEQVDPRQFHAGQAMRWPAWCEVFIARHLVLLGRGSRATRQSIIARHLMRAPEFERLAVHQIDEAACQAWIISQRTAGAAPSTVRARFALLRRMLRAAADAGFALTPPRADRLEFPRDEAAPRNIHAKAFSEAEVARILEHAPEPLGTVAALCRYLGLRAGEALGLSWDAVNVTTGAVEIRQQAQDGQLRTLKTRSSAATLRAPGPLLERLRAYRETWAPNPAGLLFAAPDGSPLAAAALRHELHHLLERLAIPRRGFHGLRHRCALAMAEAGVNPEALRRAMRHASLRNTAVYLSASPEDIAAALEAASRVVAEVLRTDTQSRQENPAFSATDADPQTNK